MNYEYDVLVLGGGPAGAEAARAASEGSLSVLLIDQHKLPWRKSCGGDLPHYTVEEFNIPMSLGNQITNSILDIADGTYRIDLEEEKPGLIVDRLVFDEFLRDRARKTGAEIQDNLRAYDLIKKNGHICGAKIKGTRSKKTEMHTIKAPITIIACGCASNLPQRMGIRKPFDREEIVISVASICTGYKGPSDTFILYFA